MKKLAAFEFITSKPCSDSRMDPQLSVDTPDHSYSYFHKTKKLLERKNQLLTPEIDNNRNTIMPLTTPTMEKSSTLQVKSINDLKKLIGTVKVVGPQAKSVKELERISMEKKKRESLAKEKLKNYCRTCAGRKLDLVDIFSDEGKKKRYDQQMKHLLDINEFDGLSTLLCRECIGDLKMSYTFFMQIKKAEVKLKLLKKTRDDQNQRLLESQSSIKNTSNDVIVIEDDDRSLVPVEKQSKKHQLIVIDVPSEVSEKNQKPSDEDIHPVAPDFHTDDSILNNIPALVEPEEQESLECIITPVSPAKSPEKSAQIPDDEAGPAITLPIETEQNQPSAESTVPMETEPTESPAIENESSQQEVSSTSEIQVIHENSEQKNIEKNSPSKPLIKRKRLISNSEPINSITAFDSQDAFNPKALKSAKIQKLMKNAVKVMEPPGEPGIMYVTVVGKKPDELLLVKVKKLDKSSPAAGETATDKKEDNKSGGKKSIEGKPVDKSTAKQVATPVDSLPILAIREKAIEEEIEQYKKRREKLLGGTVALPNSMRYEDSNFRYVAPTVKPVVLSKPPVDIKLEPVDYCNDDESTVLSSSKNNETTSSNDTSSLGLKEDPFEKLERVKREWLNSKKLKADEFRQELSKTTDDRNIERLSRVLCVGIKLVREFYDHLKQRKISIVKLKDPELVKMYEERLLDIARTKFPDLIDDDKEIDDFGKPNLFECDYCINTYNVREELEEHLQQHDVKLLYYCDDCAEEFTTAKAKRIHNITCINKLVCKVCDKMLDSKGKKRQHEQQHYDNKWGQLCDICGEKFKHQGTLDQHIKTQHMTWEKIYQCPKCPKKFAFKQKLSFHLKTVHTTIRAFLCEDCGADFKNPASLRHHRVRKHHPTTNKKECPVCHKLVPFYSLSKHMYTHKSYSIKCPHCDKMFKNTSTLKQHVRIHEDQRQYRCDTCGVGFNRRDGLRLHMKVHEKTDSRALKECSCQICAEKFPNYSMLVLHRNRFHKNTKQYTCKICNRSMLSQRSLEWHMAHRHNEPVSGPSKDDDSSDKTEKRVSCQHCDKTFKTEMILRTHIKNTHVEKNPVKCSDCDLTFLSEIRLRHHAMLEHNHTENTIQCPVCEKRFVTQLRLKTHMISHSEDRPFKCDECGFDLKTKIQLIKHKQNKHSNERPLQCRYCDWRCKQVSALKCHERTHTNERPYACSVCKQRFKYLGDKNKHERRHEAMGGSGFKRIVTERNARASLRAKFESETSNNSEDQQIEHEEGDEEEDREEEEEEEQEFSHEEDMEQQEEENQEYIEGELVEQPYENEMIYDGQCIIKHEQLDGYYEQDYEQYEEGSLEAAGTTVELMADETGVVYTEEIPAFAIDGAQILTDELIPQELLQDGSVFSLQQQGPDGEIKNVPYIVTVAPNGEISLAPTTVTYEG